MVGAVFFFSSTTFSFQTDLPSSVQGLDDYQLVEAGLATSKNVSPALYFLSEREYARALEEELIRSKGAGWLYEYLKGLCEVSKNLVRFESEHFILWLPPNQTFLKEYLIPSLEKSAAAVEKSLGFRSPKKITVEVYPTKEDFSVASTLSLETLERSGAIGICKFHRLMVMSPQSLPLGYRWLDALSHEYLHLAINELSHSKAELWLHEGTARYFETGYRLDPPVFLTPDQKTKLMEALEGDTLVKFARMSPSMVYLKDQEEVSLAFAQVSHAVSLLVGKKGVRAFSKFLMALRNRPFETAFQTHYSMDTTQFEKQWQERLAQEKWEKSKGTMADEVIFKPTAEDDFIGAESQAQVRLGDRMRRQGLNEAALIQYEKALEVEPDNAVILLKAAKMDIALGQTSSAIHRLSRAIQKNPNYVTPYIELGGLLEPAQALPHLQEAIAINPFDPRPHRMLEGIYQSLGQTNSALFEREVYLKLSQP